MVLGWSLNLFVDLGRELVVVRTLSVPGPWIMMICLSRHDQLCCSVVFQGQGAGLETHELWIFASGGKLGVVRSQRLG